MSDLHYRLIHTALYLTFSDLVSAAVIALILRADFQTFGQLALLLMGFVLSLPLLVIGVIPIFPPWVFYIVALNWIGGVYVYHRARIEEEK